MTFIRNLLRRLDAEDEAEAEREGLRVSRRHFFYGIFAGAAASVVVPSTSQMEIFKNQALWQLTQVRGYCDTITADELCAMISGNLRKNKARKLSLERYPGVVWEG